MKRRVPATEDAAPAALAGETVNRQQARRADRQRRATHLAIGPRIKFRRLQLGLTLKQIAERSGLSAPFLSQAERNQTVPSLVSVLALANALEVDIGYFLEVPTVRSIICRAKQRPQILLDSPVEYFDVSSSLAHRQMDAIVMRIPPGHSYPIDQREGEEFMMVLQGELDVMIGEICTTLKAGDSAHFTSQLAHSSTNTSGKTVTVLYVGTPAIFAEEARSG